MRAAMGKPPFAAIESHSNVHLLLNVAGSHMQSLPWLSLLGLSETPMLIVSVSESVFMATC